MARLTKATAKLHQQAVELLKNAALSEDDKWFIYEHWQESAEHINCLSGAFFTPVGLARDFALETWGSPIVDLCAGTGILSFMAYNYAIREGAPRIVCVEANPDYIKVGKRLLPEAEWVEADVFNLPDLGHFGCAIGNPPFGAVKKSGKGPRYTGSDFELGVVDVASDIADHGAFIIPQMSAPFRYSGAQYFQERETEKSRQFLEQTKIALRPGVGIDCDYHQEGWKFTSPKVEIVTADFEEARVLRASSSAKPPEQQPNDQPGLFDRLAAE